MLKCFIFMAFLPLLCSGQMMCCGINVNQAAVQMMAPGALTFSFNLNQQLRNSLNLIFSPFSIRTVLGMTSQGAGGATQSQMDTVLQLSGNQSQINQGFQNVLNSICPNSNYVLQTANRIYVDNSLPLSPTFSSTLQTYYFASAVNVDFKNNAPTVTTQINSWVSQQTSNKINNLFSSSDLSAQTRLVLVNAIYFKGNWAQQFNQANTQSEAFTVGPGQTVNVPMMNQQNTFPYFSSSALNCEILQLNYAGNDITMYVVLPSTSSSLSTLQSQLNPAQFNSLIQSVQPRLVNVKLPKFTINYRQQLNGPLINMGMTNAFNSNADFSGITGSTGNQLAISTVVHQAFVSVDEMGTTAAAATGVGIGILTVPVPTPFYVTRPFMFFIYDTKIGQNLFVGQVSNPSASSS